jgi:hypothetical protein
MLDGQFFPQTMHGPFADVADDLLDLRRLDAAFGERDRAYGLNAIVDMIQLSPSALSAGSKSGVRDGANALKKPWRPSSTVRGPSNPARAISVARMPDCAAQPACMRFVDVPSARYSMMPDAMLPAMPSADVAACASSRNAAATPAAAASAPITAVGWKPAE